MATVSGVEGTESGESQATCPANRYLTGGGALVTGSNVALKYSYPGSSGSQVQKEWKARAIVSGRANDGGNDTTVESGTVQAFAICTSP